MPDSDSRPAGPETPAETQPTVAGRLERRSTAGAADVPTRRTRRATGQPPGPAGRKSISSASAATKKSEADKAEAERAGVRSLFVGFMALFTAIVTLFDKFVRAIDLLRNPVIGLAIVVVALGVMLVSAGYVLLRPAPYSAFQRRLAWAGVVVVAVSAVIWCAWTAYEILRPPRGLIVVIADFEQAPGARSVDYARRIEAGLNESLRKLKVEGVFVERSREVYTENDARSRAAARKAAVVVYGWYDEAGVNPRFELVRTPEQYLPILKQSAVELASLDRLELRVDRELKEMNYIAAATIGLSYYADGQNSQALSFFDLALTSPVTDTRMLGREAVYFYKGSTHVFLNQYAQALPALREAVRLKPDFAEAHRNLAIVYNASCDPKSAMEQVDEALRLKPEDASGHQLKGLMLLRSADVEGAIAALTTALRYAPGDAGALQALADALDRSGRKDESAAARKRADDTLRSRSLARPDDAAALSAYGDSQYASGQLSAAADTYRQAISKGESQGLRPDRLAWLHRSLGMASWGQGRWQEMVTAYARAVELAPGLYTDQAALGVAYQALNRLDDAERAYQAALAILPCDANTHSLLAGLYDRQGRFEQALSQYGEALKSEPDDPVAWQSSGILLSRLGRDVEASEAFERAADSAAAYLSRDPRDADITYLLGAAYVELGDYPRAVDAFRKSAALSGEAESFYAAGNALYQTRDYAGALEAYRAARGANPGHAASAAGEGDALSRLNRPAEAITAYRESLALADDAYTRYALADLLEKHGQAEEAVTEYRASLRLREDRLVRFALASLLGTLGRVAEAEAEYLALVKTQDDADARMSLGRLYQGQGRLPEATTQYRRAADLYAAARRPVADSARVALASVLARQCRAAEGIEALAPSVTPSGQASLESLMQLAVLYETVGRVSDASSTYGLLKTAGKDSPAVHYLAGGFAYRQGRTAEAVQELETAIRLAPAFSLARSALGGFHAAQGRLIEAEAAFDGALAGMPSNVGAITGKALLAMERGDMTGAAVLLEQAEKVQPEYARAVSDETNAALLTIRLYRGMVRELQGDEAGAREAYTGGVDLARKTTAALPGHPLANFQLGVALWLAGDRIGADAAFASASRCDSTLAGEQTRTLARLTKLLKR